MAKEYRVLYIEIGVKGGEVFFDQEEEAIKFAKKKYNEYQEKGISSQVTVFDSKYQICWADDLDLCELTSGKGRDMRPCYVR